MACGLLRKMWKVVRGLSGGGGSRVMTVVLTRGAFNCTSSSRTVVKFNDLPFNGVVSRNYNSVGQKGGITVSSSRQRSYKSSNENERVPAGGWFLLVIPVSTLCLGIWQVFRWRWKLGLIEEMRLKSVTDPVPLPDSDLELEELEYRKVNVRGEFDYSKEVIMGPRSLVKYVDHRSGEQGRGLFSSGSGNNGYHVITPFKLEGKNESILVNRGWINSRNPQKFKHVEGPIEIVGIVRKTEQRAPFMSKNRPGQTLLHYRDVPTMAELLATNHVFLDLYSIEGIDFSQARADSVPVPRQTRVTLRNEHVSYFVTWFSLSAITSLMWHRRFIRGLNLL